MQDVMEALEDSGKDPWDFVHKARSPDQGPFHNSEERGEHWEKEGEASKWLEALLNLVGGVPQKTCAHTA